MPYNNYINKYLKVSSLCKKAQNEFGSILFYKSFIQTWSNTATIWCEPGCIVGSGFTTKKVSLFYTKKGSVAVYVDDTLAYVVQYPNTAFREDVEDKNLEYVYLAKDRYERKEYNLGSVFCK